MASLSVSGVSKSFGSVPVLIDQSLEVAEGEFVALLGPSGCGKSTLLQIINGLTSVDAGRVVLDGQDVTGKSGTGRGMVFQGADLFPWRSALENVAFGLEVMGVPRKERLERARHYLHLVGLKGFEDAWPHQLSGGMQQRVAICRSLVLDPKILLMDEPFSALDALTREELQFELRRIHRHTGKTILFVTHSISESVLLADRIVVMAPRPGRLKDSFVVELAPDRTPATLHDPRFAQYSDRVREGIYGRAAA